jgi:hypothetical protein
MLAIAIEVWWCKLYESTIYWVFVHFREPVKGWQLFHIRWDSNILFNQKLNVLRN